MGIWDALRRWLGVQPAAPNPDVVYAAGADVHAAIIELHDALIEANIEDLGWRSRVGDGFAELVAALDRLDAIIAAAPRPDPMLGMVHLYRARASVAFRRAAELWGAGEILAAGERFRDGKVAWNAMNDEVDRLAAEGFLRA